MIFDLLRVNDWPRLLPRFERFPAIWRGYPPVYRIEWLWWACWIER